MCVTDTCYTGSWTPEVVRRVRLESVSSARQREREDGCLRSIPILLYWEYFRLVFVEHLVEGIIQLSGHSVNLQFLSDDLVFKFINPEVKLADVHLCILRARF